MRMRMARYGRVRGLLVLAALVMLCTDVLAVVVAAASTVEQHKFVTFAEDRATDARGAAGGLAPIIPGKRKYVR